MLSAPVDLEYMERRLAVASRADFKLAPRSRTRWTPPVLTIGIGAEFKNDKPDKNK